MNTWNELLSPREVAVIADAAYEQYKSSQMKIALPACVAEALRARDHDANAQNIRLVTQELNRRSQVVKQLKKARTVSEEILTLLDAVEAKKNCDVLPGLDENPITFGSRHTRYARGG